MGSADVTVGPADGLWDGFMVQSQLQALLQVVQCLVLLEEAKVGVAHVTMCPAERDAVTQLLCETHRLLIFCESQLVLSEALVEVSEACVCRELVLAEGVGIIDGFFVHLDSVGNLVCIMVG